MKIKLLVLYGVLLIGMGAVLQGCLGSSEDPNAAHNAEIAVIDQYIQAHSLQNVLYDNILGVRFQVHDYGDGAPPHDGDIVVGTYSAKILGADGTLTDFDFGTINTKLENLKPNALYILASVMLEGSTGTLFSPSRYGFGETGDAGKAVPPNAIVVYTLQLTDVGKTTSWKDRLEIDTAAIKDYIVDEAIEGAIQHPSGFWYTIDQPGTGEFPRPYSFVSFDYKLRVLLASGPGNLIEDSSITGMSVWGLIDALKLGIPLLQEGTEATFYIPSGLAYGDQDKGQIQKNSILIFKIKLTDIVTY